MAFYIKPPDGYGSLEKLRVYALRRIGFLGDVLACGEAADFRKLLEAESSAIDSECLIEGSRNDRISHFLLRLICSQHTEISTFYIRAETELFCHRFSCMNSEELVHLLSSTHRFLSRLQRKGHLDISTSGLASARKAGSSTHTSKPDISDTSSLPSGTDEQSGSSLPSEQIKARRVGPFVPSAILRSRMAYTQTLMNLLDVLRRILHASESWKRAIEHYMEYSPEVFGIPFQHALCLVATRRVTLQGGIAWVKFADLHVVLAALFEDIVREGIRVASLVPRHFLEDDRLVSVTRDSVVLFYRMQSDLMRTVGRPRGTGKNIQAWEVDRQRRLFPPCMSHLHRTLRRKHRLRHFSRVQYTLFLKDIGLPVMDAINFWKAEYTKPASGCHDNKGGRGGGGGGGGGCQHSWVKDGRRYTYNIRHLYGLEGSRIDYKSHSCRSLQETQPGYGEEGGCPFKHFDDRSLRTMLDIEDIAGPKRAQILQAKENKRYQVACRAYFDARFTALCSGESSVSGCVSDRVSKDIAHSSLCSSLGSSSLSDTLNKKRAHLNVHKSPDNKLPSSHKRVSKSDATSIVPSSGSKGKVSSSGSVMESSVNVSIHASVVDKSPSSCTSVSQGDASSSVLSLVSKVKAPSSSGIIRENTLLSIPRKVTSCTEMPMVSYSVTRHNAIAGVPSKVSGPTVTSCTEMPMVSDSIIKHNTIAPGVPSKVSGHLPSVCEGICREGDQERVTDEATSTLVISAEDLDCSPMMVRTRTHGDQTCIGNQDSDDILISSNNLCRPQEKNCSKDTGFSCSCSCDIHDRQRCEGKSFVGGNLKRVCAIAEDDCKVKVQRLDLCDKLGTSGFGRKDTDCSSSNLSYQALAREEMGCNSRSKVRESLQRDCAIADNDSKVKVERSDPGEILGRECPREGSQPLIETTTSTDRTLVPVKSNNESKPTLKKKAATSASIIEPDNSSTELGNANIWNCDPSTFPGKCSNVKGCPSGVSGSGDSSSKLAVLKSGNSALSNIKDECSASLSSLNNNHRIGDTSLGLKSENSQIKDGYPPSLSGLDPDHRSDNQSVSDDPLKFSIFKPVDFYHSFAKLLAGLGRSESMKDASSGYK